MPPAASMPAAPAVLFIPAALGAPAPLSTSNKSLGARPSQAPAKNAKNAKKSGAKLPATGRSPP
jgi:hypothetical protein